MTNYRTKYTTHINHSNEKYMQIYTVLKTINKLIYRQTQKV